MRRPCWSLGIRIGLQAFAQGCWKRTDFKHGGLHPSLWRAKGSTTLGHPVPLSISWPLPWCMSLTNRVLQTRAIVALHSSHGYLIALTSILLLCLADYIITDRRAPACQSRYFNQRNNSIAATLLTFSPSPRIFRLSHDCIALPLSIHFQIQCATTRKCSTNALMSATSSKHGVPNTNKHM
jgi:hypothetical protein